MLPGCSHCWPLRETADVQMGTSMLTWQPGNLALCPWTVGTCTQGIAIAGKMEANPGQQFLEERYRRACAVPSSEASAEVTAFVNCWPLLSDVSDTLSQAVEPDLDAANKARLRRLNSGEPSKEKVKCA